MTPTAIAQISRLALQDLSAPLVATITDVKQLSSYNWIEAPSPTIAVPGTPPLWSAPSAPRQLKKDSGLVYIAQNAARHPDSPLEPLFRALSITNPSFDIRSTDVVTDRNNIRKLLSFINPSMTRNGLETFTINIEVTKNTAIFSRDETVTHEFIGPDEFKGYGHEFEKAYTTGQIGASTGHHRIITYRFGGLNFIVRHETDGYVDHTKMSSSDDKGPESDSLSSMLGSLSLSPTKGLQITTPGSKLRIKEEGQMISLESTLELKTRVIHKRIEIREVAPQLWISQTPKLVRAYHQRGTFQVPEVEDVAAVIKTWEEDNQRDLRKLAALISEIIDMVKGCGGNAIVKYDRLGDKLVIWKVNRRKMLPKDLYSMWDDRTNSEAPSNSDTAAVEPVNGIESKPDGKSAVFRPRDTKGKHESATNCEGSQPWKRDPVEVLN
ncbi:hypothetical protein V496_01570 [Pseudogymnoascus sp. VKM F-4515 (FW-2607)]|nr:hypothetical protein V496_01570 [Pseudogymnoascus sp. VKM F-4515 (FW-2607)]